MNYYKNIVLYTGIASLVEFAVYYKYGQIKESLFFFILAVICIMMLLITSTISKKTP